VTTFGQAWLRARHLARALVPAGLLELRDRRIQRDTIWRGIHERPWDAPDGLNRATEAWIRDGRDWVVSLLAAHESGSPLPSETWAKDGEHRTLLAAAALLAADRDRLTVFDFGGGLGDAYVYLKDSLLDRVDLDYHVRELPRLCEEGRTVFRDYPGIQFHPQRWPEDRTPDICYSNGSLQYTPDPMVALAEMAELRPTLLLLVELPARESEPFVTAQLNLGQPVPVWITALDQVRSLPGTHGYKVILESRGEVTFSQEGLPEDHRITDLYTLLFAREDGRQNLFS
jgi:putative methyltransferase (TIGR04325 family)